MSDRELMVGRMRPVVDPERTASTRRAFLSTMFAVVLAAAGHACYLGGVWAGQNIFQ